MYRDIRNDLSEKKYYLFDEKYVSSTSGCRLEYQRAVKDPASPIIKKTIPWEGFGPTAGNILYDPEQKKYRMYYSTFEDGGEHVKSFYRGGLAESFDGLNWEKPLPYQMEYNGQTYPYYLSTEDDGVVSLEKDVPIIKRGQGAVLDPRPECPEHERYKSLYSRRFIGGIIVYVSADGVHWKTYSDDPVWDACSDIIRTFWDEKLNKFVCYYKLWELRGEEIDEKAPCGSRKFSTLTPGGIREETNEDGMTSLSGKFVILHPESSAEIQERTIIVKSGEQGSDDGGGGHLTGAWVMRRVVCRAESQDFIHWEHERKVLDTDSLDRFGANIQATQVFSIGGYYLALMEVHDERGHMEIQLGTSHDGIIWDRPWRGNVLGVGAKGEYDSGMIAGVQPPIIIGNQMVFYYGGYDLEHNGHQGKKGIIGVGRAMMRKDGFACWKSMGDEIGELETQVLSKCSDSLYLNVDSEPGWVTAALLDENGREIPGYGHAQCNPFRGDTMSCENCMTAIQWNGTTKLPNAEKLKVQLRFQNASVFCIKV